MSTWHTNKSSFINTNTKWLSLEMITLSSFDLRIISLTVFKSEMFISKLYSVFNDEFETIFISPCVCGRQWGSDELLVYVRVERFMFKQSFVSAESFIFNMYRIIFKSSSKYKVSSTYRLFSWQPQIQWWNFTSERSYRGVSTLIRLTNLSLFLKVNLRNFLSLPSRSSFLTSNNNPNWSYLSKTQIKFSKKVFVSSNIIDTNSLSSLTEQLD